MDEVTTLIAQVAELAKGHAWVPLAALVIGLVIRLSKSDATWAFLARFNIPVQARPWAALALGVASGVLQAVTGGASWAAAIVGGLLSAVMAITGHELFVESLRGGREAFEKKAP